MAINLSWGLDGVRLDLDRLDLGLLGLVSLRETPNVEEDRGNDKEEEET